MLPSYNTFGKLKCERDKDVIDAFSRKAIIIDIIAAKLVQILTDAGRATDLYNQPAVSSRSWRRRACISALLGGHDFRR